MSASSAAFRAATALVVVCISTLYMEHSHAAQTLLRQCEPTELIELGMVKPLIVACEATSPAIGGDSSATTKETRAPLCESQTPCGQLLPYLAYMVKDLCEDREKYAEFADKLLKKCADFPYQSIDPKMILVGKPPAPVSTKATVTLAPTIMVSTSSSGSSTTPSSYLIDPPIPQTSVPVSSSSAPTSDSSSPAGASLVIVTTVGACMLTRF